LIRKARETLITRSLEHHLTKERILELYLNVAEWGQGVYGAEAAARHHFKKSSRDLTADEAAWLAAILPAPRRYDPMRKTTALAHRNDTGTRLRSRFERRASSLYLSLSLNLLGAGKRLSSLLGRLRGIADLTTLSFAEDRRLMEIVLELKEIPGGIFKKERVVLDPGAGEPDAGLLVDRQLFCLGLLQELLPRFF
jgi:hypothetical protein